MAQVKQDLWQETEENHEVLPPEYQDYLNELYSSDELNKWLDELNEQESVF